MSEEHTPTEVSTNTTTLSLEKFSPIRAKTQEITTKYGTLAKKPITSPEDYKLADEARKEVKRVRLQVEDTRKLLGEDARRWVNQVNTIAKEVAKPFVDIETDFETRQKEYMDEIERKRIAEENAKREKLQARKLKLQQAGMTPNPLDWTTYQIVGRVMTDETILALTEDAFIEIVVAGEKEQAEKKAKAEAEQKAREEAERQRKIEEQKLAEERARLEAEKRQQAEEAEKLRKEREEIERLKAEAMRPKDEPLKTTPEPVQEKQTAPLEPQKTAPDFDVRDEKGEVIAWLQEIRSCKPPKNLTNPQLMDVILEVVEVIINATEKIQK